MKSRWAGGEAGETLVEVLVAILILGLGVVGLMGGLGTAVFGSSLHRQQSDLDAAMVWAAETAKSLTYQPCSPGATVAPAYTFSGAKFSSSTYNTWPVNLAPLPGIGYFTYTVQAWYPPVPPATVGSFQSVSAANPCPALDIEQQLTITGVSQDRNATQQLTVLKGNWG